MNKKSAAGYTALLLVVIVSIIGILNHHAHHKRMEGQLKNFLDSLRRRDSTSSRY